MRAVACCSIRTAAPSSTDPTRPALRLRREPDSRLRDALAPLNVRHMGAVLTPAKAGELMRDLHGKINGRPHLVPLAPQALAILAELRPLTGHGRYVFPSMLTGDECMSENTLRAALRRLGCGNEDMTAHGFRAMARTRVAETLHGIAPDVVEARLAHGKTGPLGMACDRDEYMQQRCELMQRWADYLDLLRDGAQVIPLEPRAA